MHKRGLCRHAMCVRPSVCVCPSARSWILSKRINISWKLFHRRIATPFSFFLAKRHGNILTRTQPRTVALNAGGVGKNHDFRSVSGFIACCKRCDRLVVINMVPPDRGKLWHLSLVVNGRVCCWRKTTTKCLWQEISTLRQRQQNSI